MLVIVNKPFLEFLLLSLNQSVLVFKFKLSLNCDGIHLIIDFLAHHVMDRIPFLELQKWWLMIFIFFKFILLAQSDTLFAFVYEFIFKLIVEWV